MVVEITGVVKLLLPVSNAVPPDAAAYQSMVLPEPGLAESETVPEPHLPPSVTVGAGGSVFKVATTAVRVAETQPVVVFLDSA